MFIEKTVDRDGQQKLYVQICGILKSKVENGEWPAGSQIPTEDELCKTYDVSKATVRIALSELARDGYLVRKQGKGTFVSCLLPQTGMNMKTRLTENMFGEGVKVRKEVLHKCVTAPPAEIQSYLKAGDDIYYVLCKRLVEGETACVEESFFPLFMFPGIEEEDLCNTSFYNLVQKRSVCKISKVLQTIEITELGHETAEILKTERKTPALLLHRLIMGQNEMPIAYTRLMGTGRTYKIQTEFEKIR